MNQSTFRKLTASIRQAGKIRRGRLRPGRVTTFKPAEVRAVREKAAGCRTARPGPSSG